MMKHIYFGMLACGLMMTGCQNELYTDPVADFQSAQAAYMVTDETTQIFVEENKDVSVKNIVLGLSKKENKENTVALEVGSQSQLDAYNQKHGTDYILLPKEMYQVEELVKFKEEQTSLIVPLEIKDVKFSTKGTYALPMRVNQSSVVAIPGQTETLLVLEQRINTKCVRLDGSGSEDPNMFPNDFKVEQWTMEAMIKRSTYMFNNRSIGGTKLVKGSNMIDEIYTRFGDVTIKPNQLQIKTGNSQIDIPADKFSAQPDEWYMLSFVYDGKKNYVYVNGELVADREIRTGPYGLVGFWIGGSNEYIREVRFWKTARTPQQLKAYVWKMVDATDKDLLLYYPLNGKKRDAKTGEITDDETKFWDWSTNQKHLPLAKGAKFENNGGKGFVFPMDK